MAKVYIVSFRTHGDRRPSKFIVLADSMKSAINMAWEHGGADFQSRFDHRTSRTNERRGITRPMTIFEALAILESAVLECKKRNVNTPEATAALDLLAPYVRPKLVVAQFRHHIARERDNDHEKEGRQQVLRATFAEIRNSIRELIGTEMDELARDFPDTDDMELKMRLNAWLGNMASSVSRGCSFHVEAPLMTRLCSMIHLF